MRQSLQSKFNVLGLLLVAFFLLMLPMFTQVKQDTRDSLKEARSTALYKFSRDLAKDFKPEDFDNTKVEDSWDDYVNDAREQNPDCAACNPDEDADGDNMTNKDEVEAGRNPLCNEEEKGFEHCQNVDDKIKDPDVPLGTVVFIHNITFTTSGNCSGSGLPFQGTSCGSPWDFEVKENFTQLVAYLNVTNFQGQSWDINLISDEAGSWDTQGDWSHDPGPLSTGTPPRTFAGNASLSPAAPSVHSASLSYSGSTTGNPPPSGTWTILVYGIR